MQASKEKGKTNAQKPKYNMWQNSAYMISTAWRGKEKKVLALSALLAVFSVAGSVVELYVTPSVLAAVERRAPIAELIITILIFIGLMMLCSAASAYINTNALYGRVQVRLLIINAINKKAATTSYPNLGDERFKKLGTKASEATNSNMEATEAVWTTLTNLTKNVIGFIIYILLLFSLSPGMAALIGITAAAGYLIGKRVNEYGYRHREELARYENEMWYINGRARDYSAAKDIRIFGMKPWLRELGEKAMDAYTSFHRRANGVYIWGRIADLILAFARNGIAYACLIDLVLDNGLNASEFLLYFSAVGGFAGWISGIFGDLSELHKQSLEISTVREFIEYPEPFDLEAGEGLVPDNNMEYEIKLENVYFRYPESKDYTLENINLSLKSGEKLAVVGLNGAGKTTLVKLICGFFDPTEGRILLNGTDIRKYKRRDYYKMFSAVFQDFCLIAGTVSLNIVQSEENVDMERVRECAAKAGLLSRIESLSEGFETHLDRNIYEDAVMLSGGETQRLMLARALYRDSPIIILDEPTAALDPIAESELYQKYNEMTLGKSSVYISHRLASTRFCDRIILIENSRIKEEGSHEELLSLGGRYAKLFEVQSKYYREEALEDEN